MHALARHVAGDGRVRALARDLVHLVDVHDAALRRVHIIIGGLQKAHDDVFHILAHVTRFGEDGVDPAKSDYGKIVDLDKLVQEIRLKSGK